MTSSFIIYHLKMKFLGSNNFFIYTSNALWSDISGHELITSIVGFLII